MHSLIMYLCVLCDVNARISTEIAETIACIKCGINKRGKRSCCGRGGAWFNNCGDTGDRNVDHTWSQGIEACRAFDIVVESPHARSRGGHRLSPQHRSASGNDTRNQTYVYVYRHDSLSPIVTSDSYSMQMTAFIYCLQFCSLSLLILSSRISFMFFKHTEYSRID